MAREEEALKKAMGDVLKAMKRVVQLGGDIRVARFGERSINRFSIECHWPIEHGKSKAIKVAWPKVFQAAAPR